MSETRAACCMLCVTITIVKSLLELVQQLLDPLGALRVERRGRLVEQDHLGLAARWCARCRAAAAARPRARSRWRAAGPSPRPRARRDAAPAPRPSVARPCEPPVQPQSRPRRCRRSTSWGRASGFWNTMPTRRRSCIAFTPRRVDVLAVEQHLPGDPAARGHLVHPVERAQERGLAAARRTDQRVHLVGREGERRVLDRRELRRTSP